MSKLPDPTTQATFYKDVPLKRLFAWVLDGIISFVMTVIISVLLLGIPFFFFFGLWAVVSVIYRVLSITGGSATWGMRFVGIELRTSQAHPMDFIMALLHTIGTLICMATGLQIISIILMLFTARGQGLVDLVLGTAAVNKMARY